jgi:hypothetical protein
MNLRVVHAVVVVALTGLVYSAAAQSTGSDRNRIIRTVKLPDGGTFVVTIARGKWSGAPYKNAQLWGGWGLRPTTVITLLTASRNKEALFVPFSSYADLAEPHTFDLRLNGKDVELEITGASEGYGYRAVLVFARGRYLSNRRVESSVMPTDAYEETKYSVAPESR